jgi:hypothetical protein
MNEARKNEIAETSLGRALRRIAKGNRLSSLDVPILEDAADELDHAKAALTSYEEERIPPSAIRALAEAVAINDAAGPWNDPIAMALVIRAARDLVHGVALQEGPSGEGWQQRIAAMEPYLVTQYDDQRCFFCGEYSEDDHTPTCLWQNAKDATPPASRGEGASKP